MLIFCSFVDFFGLRTDKCSSLPVHSSTSGTTCVVSLRKCNGSCVLSRKPFLVTSKSSNSTDFLLLPGFEAEVPLCLAAIKLHCC